VASAATRAAERLWKAAPGYAYGEAFGIWWGEGLWGEFAGDDPGLASIRAYLPTFRECVWSDALAAAGASDAAVAAEMQRAYVSTRTAHETLDPEAEPVLIDLARDHRLALLTNGAGDVQRAKLGRTPFARYFETIVISVEAGIGKPDPRIFALAASRVGVAPADATMVGDSLVRDIAGAQRAGLRAVWIDRGLWREPGGTKPDAVVKRLSDLRAALDELERRPVSPRARS
jgi:putative hydrolase of the HAD superfamily